MWYCFCLYIEASLVKTSILQLIKEEAKKFATFFFEINDYCEMRRKLIVFCTAYVCSYDFVNKSYENISVYRRPVSSQSYFVPVSVVLHRAVYTVAEYKAYQNRVTFFALKYNPERLQ